VKKLLQPTQLMMLAINIRPDVDQLDRAVLKLWPHVQHTQVTPPVVLQELDQMEIALGLVELIVLQGLAVEQPQQ
jgi:hypothetical protein